MFDSITDSEIEATIERQHTDEDSYTPTEIRDILNQINKDILGNWSLYQYAIDDNSYEITHEDTDIIVLTDKTGHFWKEQFEAMGLPNDESDTLYGIIVSLHHNAARTHCDYQNPRWNPVVIKKTDEFQTGEAHILREIARRTKKHGSVARAVDTIATENHTWSKSNWATQTGRNPSTVTRTTDN